MVTSASAHQSAPPRGSAGSLPNAGRFCRACWEQGPRTAGEAVRTGEGTAEAERSSVRHVLFS